MPDTPKRMSSDRRYGASSGRGGWSPQMYMNPGGDTPGFSYGVLRRTFRGKPCSVSASEFVRRKLYPIEAPPEGCWEGAFTCMRLDVLLPPGCVDEFMDARRLLDAYERHLPAWRQGILCVLKVTQPVNEPLQASYERIRFAARISFALRRNVPAIVVAHAPFLSGAALEHRRPHCHIIALGMQVAGVLGFAGTDDEITSDAGHLALFEEFKAVGAIP
jgi:hypothetical protein